ncbi:MAG: hypothetical protein M0Z48_06000 [Nitrospiraceae bacterium]|nr:hypothetical protein [Nitrospiraceae bacterium]
MRLRGGRVSLDSRRCWVDARAFESMLEKAAALYRGPFLPDEGKPVIKSYRERLQARFSGLSKS